MTEQTREHSLDELARGLASGAISRSKALRLVGGMLGGAVLASVPGVALAQQDCLVPVVRAGMKIWPPER